MADRFQNRSLPDLLRFHARERWDSAALVFEGRETSFEGLHRASSRVANALLASGFGPGTRVAILDRDSDRTYALIFGTALARGVVLGVNWRLAPREIAFILNDGGVRVLFVGAEFLPKVEEILERIPGVERIVTLSGERPGWPAIEEWLAPHAEDDPGLAADPEEVVVQMYTSGTTGNPKGVQLANRSFFEVVRSMHAHGDDWIGWSERDTSLSGFPSFHIGGFWWGMTGLNAGARTAIIDSFVGWRFLELLERERVTKTCMVPSMLQLLLSEPACKRTDFSALGHIVYGGSPIPLPLLRRSIEVFGCEFAQIYGLTETGNTAVCLRPDDHRDQAHERMHAAGRPYPGVRAKVIDPEGRPLAPRAIGEICLHSPANMIGYWNLPEATERTLVDGWVHTGDAGWIDEQGYVFVCDRVKDMIIYAGENVYPAEIESVLAGHPAVAEVAVIGVPDERWGELVKAVVVLRPGEQTSQRDLLAFARRELADFKVPRSVDFAESLPRTSSGKVRKAVLREPYWQGRERRVN